MATEVILVRVDEGMTEGTIREWKKKEGDWVEKGEILYILETAKVAFEVEAPASGRLSKVIAKAGEVVPVGMVIAYILGPGEEAPEIPLEQKAGREMDRARVAMPEASTKPEATEETIPLKASPLARSLAREHQINLSLVRGSGPGGRITKEDVMQAIEKAGKKEEVVPLTSMRRTIAQRMTESFQSIPHAYLSMEVDTMELGRLRETLIPSIEKQTALRLTYTDLLLKIVAQAVKEYPYVNVTWTRGGIKSLNEVNLGLAVSLREGLMVPVIRQANAKSLAEIARLRNDYAKRAQEGKISLDEMRGSSITLTNLGMFGIDQFNAIINPSESSILAVGRITDKPVVHQGQIVIRPRMNLTLSIDHRVLDGVSGSQFLGRIKELIENPMLLIL
jgi:pyruvate dehydrogenase E2 component (dihydrolipoamide acetyltransferase)